MSIGRLAAIVVVATLTGCAPRPLYLRASHELRAGGKHLRLADHGRIEDREIYTFCRDERSRDVGNLLPIGERTYNGACVTYVCPVGDDGRHCR